MNEVISEKVAFATCTQETLGLHSVLCTVAIQQACCKTSCGPVTSHYAFVKALTPVLEQLFSCPPFSLLGKTLENLSVDSRVQEKMILV